MNDLNRKTANSFDADVRNASYTLNYSWAKSLYAQKDYAPRRSSVDAALAVKRSDEASALKRQIAAAKTKADTGVSFDAALQDIDRLIAAEELVSAQPQDRFAGQGDDGPDEAGDPGRQAPDHHRAS